MLSKNLNKSRRKPGATTVALLSILLGAQVAVFADIQYDFNYGFNKGTQAKGVMDAETFAPYIVGICNGHFTASVDINECIYGGDVGYYGHPPTGGGGNG